MVEPVPEGIDFAEEEGKILEYWKKIDAFNKSLKLSKGKPRLDLLRFLFHDCCIILNGMLMSFQVHFL